MKTLTLIIAVCLILPARLFADDPTSQPSLIEASDKAALEAALGKDVVVAGTVSTAAWSAKGTVLLIKFKGAEESNFAAVVFERTRPKFDDSYGGDVAKTLTGAKVRVRGKLQEYKPGGSGKGRPEIILNLPDQITIVEVAATQP